MKRKFWAVLLFIFIFAGTLSLFGNLSPTSLDKEQKINAENPLGTITTLIFEKKEFQIEEDHKKDPKGVLVTRVIDGDTIEIEGGKKVRYIGIDTPETVHPSKSVQCYGKEAAEKNKNFVEGKRVRLEKDISETDKYGRLLRYVYLPAGKAGVGEVFVNKVLVQEGYAFSSTYPPDIKYQDVFLTVEKEAREASRGLWGSCGFIAGVETKQTAPETDCVIKGNISSSGEKIYHLPGQRYYNKTVISKSKGERWFCSEDEAIDGGWRKAKL